MNIENWHYFFMNVWSNIIINIIICNSLNLNHLMKWSQNFYSIFKVSTCSPILHFFVWGFKQWIVKLNKQLNVIIASNDQGKNQSTEPLIIDWLINFCCFSSLWRILYFTQIKYQAKVSMCIVVLKRVGNHCLLGSQ